jgi:tetratricopeptide (TPR) repeat protein
VVEKGLLRPVLWQWQANLVNAMNLHQTESPVKSSLLPAATLTTLFLSLVLGVAIIGVTGCGRKPSASPMTHAAATAQTTAIARATITNGVGGTTSTAPTSNDAHTMQASIELSELALDGGLTNMDEAAIARFVGMFPEPAKMDAVLWDNYINSGNSNTYAVAEKIFRGVVDNYQDERSQAYARNHLGRVLYRQGRLEEALAMYESVQLQSSGQDFWYVDAKDEAGMIAYSLIGVGHGGYPAIKKGCEAAERNYIKAIEATDRENVKASMYFKLGHVYINTDPNKAQSAWRTAYHLARNSGKDSLAMEAKEAYDHYRSNATFTHRLKQENKEPL